MDPLVTISGPLRFSPGGLQLIAHALLAFGVKYGNLPATPSATPPADDMELGKTLWVGGKDKPEDDVTELEVLLLLRL